MGTIRQVVGRERELGILRAFAEHEGSPAALVIEGNAGIGKTTLWAVAVDSGPQTFAHVLLCRPGEAETRLSYAALGDLLGGVIEEARELPAPQRRALEVALLLADSEGAPPEQRAVAAALVSLLRTLASEGSVLIAIDDAQWLDAPSAAVLEFALRRLTHEPVCVLLARRDDGRQQIPLGLSRAFPAERCKRLVLGPLSLGAIHHLLRTQLDATFPRPLLRQIHEASGGNPFYALELARALERRPASSERGQTLRISGSVQELVRERLEALPERVREALLVVAALSQPTADQVESVLGAGVATEALEQAEAAGEVVFDGERIRFAHPLPGSVLYASASPGRRRQLHARLAQIVSDPEERARHLARSVARPDAEVAAALDSAAVRARARGAPDAAVELSELAVGLTPEADDEARRKRLRDTAMFAYLAGDLTRARELLESLLHEVSPGRRRAELLLWVAKSREDDFEAALELCERARAEARNEPAVLTEVELFVGIVWIIRGDLGKAQRHSQTALELAERAGDPALVTKAIAQTALLETWTCRITPGLLERGVELEQNLDTEPDFFASPSAVLGRRLMYIGELDEARKHFERAYATALQQGNEPSRLAVLLNLSELECRAGNWRRAGQLALEGHELVEQLGLAQSASGLLYARALVDAHVGDVESARREAEQAIELAQGAKAEIFRIQALAVLGFLELSRGNAEDAWRHLRSLPERLRGAGYRSPSFCPMLPNAIEASIGAGYLEEAEGLAGELARAADSPWAEAAAARSRGLLEAARGDLAAALDHLEDAVVRTEPLPMPFELGRTLLALGAVQRRARRRRAARESLQAALATFEELGARLWADKARAELARIGGRSPTGELTPSEARIAELVSDGRSNKEVAAALFVSPKTVEYHLGRIYEKLGVHSRTELAHRLRQSEAAL